MNNNNNKKIKLKMIVSYAVTLALIAICVFAFILNKQGKTLKSFIEEKADEHRKSESVNSGSDDGGNVERGEYGYYGNIETYGPVTTFNFLEDDYIRQLLSDDDFDVHYTVTKPSVEYDRDNKKGIPIKAYGESEEEADYKACISAIYQNKVNNANKPEWVEKLDGQAISEKQYIPKESEIHVGDTFRDYDSKVDWTIDNISIRDNISDLDYNLIIHENYNTQDLVDMTTGDIKQGLVKYIKGGAPANIAFLQLDVTLKSHAQWITKVAFDPQLMFIEDKGDYYNPTDYFDYMVEPYTGTDGYNIFCSKDIFTGTKYPGERFFYPLEFEEEVQVSMGWFVDKDNLDGLLLNFSTPSWYNDSYHFINVKEELDK